MTNPPADTPLVFELAGVQGSGKSTIAAEMVDRIPGLLEGSQLQQRVLSHELEQCIRLRRLSALLPRRLVMRLLRLPVAQLDILADFLANFPDVLDIVATIHSGVPDHDVRRKAMRMSLALWINRWSVAKALNAGEALLLEEGFCMRLNHFIAYQEVDDELIERYFKVIPPMDGVVFLDAPMNIMFKRIHDESRSGFRGNRSVLEATRSQLSRMARILRTLGIPVSTVQTDQPLERSVAQVEQFIRAQLSERILDGYFLD